MRGRRAKRAINANRSLPQRAFRLVTRLAIGVALLPAVGNCWAQASAPLRLKNTTEIAPFRLIGIDGYILARYLTDASISAGVVGGATARATQSSLSEEIYLMTHSYVYHPSLLLLDLGGGPVIDRSQDGGDGAGPSTRRQMFNLNARATFLRDKPYTGALFYDRSNQTQSVGPAQQMLNENTRYGATFSVRSPVTPLPLQVDITRSTSLGTGAEQVMDDRVDQLRIKMDANLGKLGDSTLQLVSTRQDSASGSAGLPIQASRIASDRANLDTRLKFGSMNEYELSNAVALNRSSFTGGQGSLASQKDASFGLDLRARHSEELQTYGRYNVNSNQQDDQSMTLNAASAGLNYRFSPDLSGALGMRGESNRASQLNSTSYALDGSAQYRQTLPLGQATAGYNVAYSQRDQQATSLMAKMLGEQMTLVSTSFVSLRHPQIMAGTVVVTNLTRTQTFVEGQDYFLSPIGLELRIQRLIGGNILDGQTVLIDYDYSSGGSYAASQFDNALSLSWAYKSYLNVFIRHFASAPRLVSGSPTSPLNSVNSTSYGARVDIPLSMLAQESLLGGSAEREVRRETISSYTRANLDAYVQMELPLAKSGNVRLGARQMQVDYDNSPLQAVKLTAVDFRLWARIDYGIDLSAEASRHRDTGGPELREGSAASIRAQWRQRKLSATVELTRVHDAQGQVERTRTYGQVLLRRDL